MYKMYKWHTTAIHYFFMFFNIFDTVIFQYKDISNITE